MRGRGEVWALRGRERGCVKGIGRGRGEGEMGWEGRRGEIKSG